MNIPLMDFAKLTSTDTFERQQEIQALDTACREIDGFDLSSNMTRIL